MEIDLVYLWVDGSDPVWRAKKEAWLHPEKGDVVASQASAASPFADDEHKAQAAGACRFSDNDELRYSLRSVEMFAPWVRHIYLVTDGQTPEWLDTSNSRVRIVPQESLLEHASETLPTFNSNTIELNLWRIPGLSECFLYANDDMFFTKPVSPSFFFDADGRPYVRLKVQSVRKHLDRMYPYTIYSAQQEVLRLCGKNYRLAPHHNVDAYNKTSFRAAVEAMGSRVEATTSHRFRDKEDLQRAAILYHAIATGQAHHVHVTRYNGADTWWKRLRVVFGIEYYADSRCIPLNVSIPRMRKTILKYNPRLLCLNDGETVGDQSRQIVKSFLQELFPVKSSFEK